MKPTSVIFIIVAVVLIIAGTITCSVAQSNAEKEGVDIFSYNYNESGDLLDTVDFRAENVNRIKISLGRCDVHIIGGGDRAEAELVNFERYKYSLSMTDGELKITDGIGFGSFVTVSSGGISFDGMRYLFPFGGKGRIKIDENAKRSVTVYLPDTLGIRKIDIEVQEGDVTVENIAYNADCSVVSASGNISVIGNAQVQTGYSLTAESGDISFDHPAFAGVADMHSSSGNIGITVARDNECEYRVDAPLGSVMYYGTSAGHAYHSGTTYPCKITAASDKGNIAVDSPASDQTQDSDTQAS